MDNQHQKIQGYRDLSQEEIDLMNEGKLLAQHCGEFIATEKQIFRFVHDEARRRASAYCMIAPEGSIAEFRDATRTLEQNAKMWPMLKDIAKQVEWYENWLTQDEWKDFFSAIILKQKVMPNMEGTGFIAVGGRTSKMNRRVFAELIELMYAFGADHDVIWSDPKHAKKMMQEAKEYLDKFNKRVSKESCGVYE